MPGIHRPSYLMYSYADYYSARYYVYVKVNFMQFFICGCLCLFFCIVCNLLFVYILLIFFSYVRTYLIFWRIPSFLCVLRLISMYLFFSLYVIFFVPSSTCAVHVVAVSSGSFCTHYSEQFCCSCVSSVFSFVIFAVR